MGLQNQCDLLASLLTHYMPAQNAQILFPVNIPGAFDYKVPPGMTLSRGDFVFAPIGKQMKLGVVWGFSEDDGSRKLKEIAGVKPTKPLSETMVNFVNWTARYSCAPLGMVRCCGNLRQTLLWHDLVV